MLSDLQVRQAKVTGKAYSLVDFDGLYFHISATGFKAWHFRFTWGGKRERMSFGGYPALSLKDARHLRDEARAMLAKGINPHSERKRKRHAIVLAGEHTFQALYDKWLAHRSLFLEKEGRQSTPKQIGRVFAKDVFPVLRHLTIYDVTRAHLLDIIGRVEKRGSLSVAEKLPSWSWCARRPRAYPESAPPHARPVLFLHGVPAQRLPDPSPARRLRLGAVAALCVLRTPGPGVPRQRRFPMRVRR